MLQLILMFMLLLHELLSLRWGPSILFSVHKSALWLYTILFSTSINELCDFYINSVPTPDLAHLSLYNTVYPCAALHHGAVIQENSHQKPRPASRFVFALSSDFSHIVFPRLWTPLFTALPASLPIVHSCSFWAFSVHDQLPTRTQKVISTVKAWWICCKLFTAQGNLCVPHPASILSPATYCFAPHLWAK